MKFRVHKNGTAPGEVGLTLKDNHGKEHTEFGSEKAAQIALLETLRLTPDLGGYDDFFIQPYDDTGTPMELVSKKDREAAAADAKWLVEGSQDLRHTMAAMLAGRQLYAFAVGKLESALNAVVQVNGEERPVHPLTVEVMIQAVANEGSRGFEPSQTLEAMAEKIMPWMHNHVKEAMVQDANDRKVEMETRKKQHREHRIFTGIPYDKDMAPLLDRAKGLVLVGYGPAVKFLLDRVVNTVLTLTDETHPRKVLTVIRFCDCLEPDGKDQERLVRVPLKAWANTAQSERKFGQMVHDKIVPKLIAMQDLLVVDDLAAVVEPAIATRHDTSVINPSRAADAYKRLMKWAKHSGFGMIAGIPSSVDKPVTMTDSSWDRLKTHSVLRPVTVIRSACEQAPDLAADKVRILVGRDAFFVDVDPAVIEPVSKIIL